MLNPLPRSLVFRLAPCTANGDAEALVHLAIALESLLRVRPGEGLTERFKDAGRLPDRYRDSTCWLEQFYTARSKAVHEGVPHDLMFYAADHETVKKRGKDKEQLIAHRPLIEYGRRIFRLGMTSMFSAATNVQMMGLAKLFVHNQERLESIRKKLDDKEKSEPATNRLHAVQGLISELCQFESQRMQPDVAFNRVLGTARQLLRTFKESKPTLSESAEKEVLEKFIAGNKATSSEQLQYLEEIAGNPVRGPANACGYRLSPCRTHVSRYAFQPGFRLRCAFDDQRR